MDGTGARRSYGAAADSRTARDSLFSGGGRSTYSSYQRDDVEWAAHDQRSSLLTTTARVDDASERLANAHRTALRTEDIGKDIQDQMAHDREVLERARGKVQHVNENMDSARRVLLGISRRVITNKIILVLIILLLIASIIVVIYLKWVRKIIHK